MVSPWHPGHPSVGIPPVDSPRHLAAPTATSLSAALPRISSPQTGQPARYASGGGPNGSSRAAGGSGPRRLRRLLPPFDGRALSMDAAIGRMPDAPHAQLPLTVRTAPRVAPAALLRAGAVGEGGEALKRSLDEALDRRQGFLHQAFALCKRLGRLAPVRAYPLATLGQYMLSHAPDKGVDRHRFPLDPRALLAPIRRGAPGPLGAIAPPERVRRTHHLCGQIRGPTLIPRRPIPRLDVRHHPLALPRGTRLHQPRDLLRLACLAQHRPQRPLPLLAAHGIRHLRPMPPWLGVLIPAAARGNTLQRGMVRPMTARRLDAHDVAALEGAATDAAAAIVQARDPAAPARTP